MNDQHPDAGYAGYDSGATGGFHGDPLFGSYPGGHDGTYGSGYGVGPADGYSGSYDSTQWDTGAHPAASYDAYAPYAAQPGQQPYPEQQYTTGPAYGTTASWTTADYGPDTASTAVFPGIPAQGGAAESTGQWDTGAWSTDGHWAMNDAAMNSTAAYDTGAYDATAWNTGAAPEPGIDQLLTQTMEAPRLPHDAHATDSTHGDYAAYETYADPATSYDPYEPYLAQGAQDPDGAADGLDDSGGTAEPEGAELASGPRRSPGRPATRSGGRGRRRTPAKRSALLTVAIPSACVMSVAGIAAASVGGLGGDEKKDDGSTLAAADSVKPAEANNKLDTQLANLSADAENFAGRASRAQERIDLRERQAAEKKKREEEAARKEAMRPKFVMPVKQHGLSAYFGQAGVNWMSVHTGIDFPVLEGTPVMAATDGVVSTRLNSAYGNMAIVTMADGTETWYCHLSSTRIRSGPVKAGDVIAYSGDTGNSTGPHLHFEVRPGGGAAVNPLPWLRSHGVNPT
ncbi:M23 family metallopeptidase [Streptomyces sp. NPDC058195]|uniref:M23 family metallopeptidase n=1 Tax=Streptomyces sp. NPDC058195 TaxID=3346375 RepID=UPI0036E0AC0C